MAVGDVPKVYSLRDRAAIPEGAVIVDRSSDFGNPFRIGPDGDRAEVLRKYRRWFKRRDQKEFRKRVRRELVGKNLVCWCAPKPCHADILLEYANRLRKRD